MEPMKKLFYLCLFLPLHLFGADGSGPASGLQAWHDLGSTVDGDTYTIDAGTHEITSGNLMLKLVNVKGSGEGSTFIIYNIPSGNDDWIDWNPQTGDGGTLTISDMTVQPHSTPVSGSKSIFNLRNFTGTLVMHDLTLAEGLDQVGMQQSDCDMNGVIYDCSFLNEKKAFYFRNGGENDGDEAWEETLDYNNGDWLFVENCTFGVVGDDANEAAFDGDGGSKIVFRYNTLHERYVIYHGTESSFPNRGGRAMIVHDNTMSYTVNARNWPIVARSGSVIAYNNTFTGFADGSLHLPTYRRYVDFKGWGSADGTFDWDDNDTSDGAGTPGGAGDGVFDSGTATAGSGTGVLEDTGKSWITDQWASYTLRQRETATTTSGGVDTLTVSGAGWTADEWAGWIVTRVSDNLKSQVDDNTADTLTLKGGLGHWNSITFAGGQDFVLSRGMFIESNTSNTITVRGQGGFIQPDPTPNATARRETGGNYIILSGDGYEIRRVDQWLDMNGAGQSNPFTTRPEHEDLNQFAALDPCYEWNNTHDGGACDFSVPTAVTQTVAGVHYFNDTQKPGYTGYTYPHPLRGASSSIILNATTTNAGNVTITP